MTPMRTMPAGARGADVDSRPGSAGALAGIFFRDALRASGRGRALGATDKKMPAGAPAVPGGDAGGGACGPGGRCRRGRRRTLRLLAGGLAACAAAACGRKGPPVRPGAEPEEEAAP